MRFPGLAVFLLASVAPANAETVQSRAGSDAARNVPQVSGDVLNAVTYGADPTAASDSCIAFTKAAGDVPAGLSGYGATIYLPKGVYLSSCGISIADKAIAIAGAGSGETQIVFTSTAAGNAGVSLTYSRSAATLAPQIRDIGLITTGTQKTGNACISITRPEAAMMVANPGPYISNVYCGGAGSAYWADGVRCAYCTFLSMQHVQIVGAGVTGATVGANMSRAVFLDNTTDANIYDTHIYYAGKGVSLDRGSEGLRLVASSIVMADYGVYTEPSWTGPSLVVSDTHLNVTTAGLHIEGGGAGGQTSQSQIHDNLIYRWTKATADPWTGIECVNGRAYGCKDHNFHDNNIIAFKGGGPTGTASCFRLGSNATDISIHDNTCRDADYFIDMGSSTSPTISVYNNHGIGSANIAWQRNQNPHAIWRTNHPVVFGTSDVVAVAQGPDATNWGFGGTAVTSFLTNSRTATTVTDAIGGWAGLVVSVRCADTNTTIANGSGAATKIALAGGANYTCPRVGATITFMYSDQWREIGRAN